MAEVGGIIFKFQLILESIYAEMKVSVHLLSSRVGKVWKYVIDDFFMLQCFGDLFCENK